jgi:hypothetical protein
MRILSAPERSVPVLHWRYAILAIQAMRAAEQTHYESDLLRVQDVVCLATINIAQRDAFTAACFVARESKIRVTPAQAKQFPWSRLETVTFVVLPHGVLVGNRREVQDMPVISRSHSKKVCACMASVEIRCLIRQRLPAVSTSLLATSLALHPFVQPLRMSV